MPRYDFECEKCKTTKEVEWTFDEYDKNKDCQICECGGSMKRVYTPIMLTEYACPGFYDNSTRGVSFR